MGSERVIIEFIGDARKLQPIVDALVKIKGLTKEEAEEFKKVNQRARSMSSEMSKATGSVKKVREESYKASSSVADMAKRAKEFPRELDRAKASMAGLNKQSSGLFGQIKRIGGAIIAAFGATSGFFIFAKFIRSLINVNREFELQMARVKAVTGATNKEFKLLAANAKKLGGSSKFTATQVALLSEEYAKLGFSVDEIIDASEATLLLAEATGVDLAEAANVAGQVLRAFGLNAAETKRVADVMALSFSKSALNMTSFAESMKFVAPIAKSANINIETTTALLGKLADAGLRGSIAGTGLKNLLSKLADANSELSKRIGFSVKSSEDLFLAFEKLKKGNIDLTEATELTDERSKAAFLTLIEGVESARQLKDALDDTTEATLEMAKVMRDTLEGDVDKLAASWEALMIQLSKSDKIRGVVQFLDKWLQITRLITASQEDLLEINIESNAEYGKRAGKAFVKDLEAMRVAFDAISPTPKLGLFFAIEKTNNKIDFLNRKISEYKEKVSEITGDGKYKPLEGYKLNEEHEDALVFIAQYEAKLKEVERAYDRLIEEKKANNALTVSETKIIDTTLSIKRLNDELKQLKKEYNESEIGSERWRSVLGEITLKTEELRKANVLAARAVAEFRLENDMISPDAHVATFNAMQKELDEWEAKKKESELRILQEEKKNLQLSVYQSTASAKSKGKALELIELDYLSKLLEYKKKWGEDTIDIELEIAKKKDAIWQENVRRHNEALDAMRQNEMMSDGVMSREASEMFKGYLNVASETYNGITALHQGMLNNQLKNLQNQIDAGLISEEKASAKRRELMRKQAELDKAAALMKAIVNVAAAVATALTAGPVIGQAIAAITAALGAIQIGIIASTPLPAYAKGTKRAPAGMKWVGEEGPELISDNGGYAIITNRESEELASNPFSKKSQEILKKYDLPQIHSGLFGNPLLKIDTDLANSTYLNRNMDVIDYDRLARSIAKEMDSSSVIRAINSHKLSDRESMLILAEIMSKSMRQQKRGNYA